MSFEQGSYVMDSAGVVWQVVRDGGMAQRLTTDGTPLSIGITTLTNEAGPLEELTVPRQFRLRRTIEGIVTDECAIWESVGPSGAGGNAVYVKDVAVVLAKALAEGRLSGG